MWLYFDLVKVNSGYYLFDVQHEVALTENGKVKVFQNYTEADDYLTQQNIRGSIRNKITEA